VGPFEATDTPRNPGERHGYAGASPSAGGVGGPFQAPI